MHGFVSLDFGHDAEVHAVDRTIPAVDETRPLDILRIHRDGYLFEEFSNAGFPQSGVDIHHMDFYMAFAFWRLAAIVEGAYCLQLNGEINSEYARGLEHDVPALLSEARLAMLGDW